MARKLRLALTTFSIVLGISFVAGTFVLTDTLQFAFTDLFGKINSKVDVVVRAPVAFQEQRGGGSAREPLPESVVDQVRAVPGVRAAQGDVVGYAQFIDKKGKAVGSQGPPTLGASISPDSTLSTITVREGRKPAGDGEVVTDARTARVNDFHLGDRVKILFVGPSREFTIVGIVGYGDLDNVGGATLAGFDLKTAQQVLDRVGLVDAIQVGAAPGVGADELRDRIDAAIDPNLDVVTGKTEGQETADRITQALGFFSTALLVFAGIALFVGAFLIWNTFSIIVAQRTQELALLRALGAQRGQVLRSVLAEAAIVGLVASIVGLVAGMAVAKGLFGLLKLFGIALPQAALQFRPRTAIVALVVGVVVTLLAAIAPAIRSTRVSPVAAMRDPDPTPSRVGTRRLVVGLLFTAVAVAVLLWGLFGHPGNRLVVVGLGAVLVFLGVAVLSPLVVQPLARVIGWPAARLFRLPGHLARENAMRNPRRTAATAAALMIGLGLISFVAVFAASLKASAGKIFDETLAADYSVQSSSQGPGAGFSTEIGARIARLPEIGESSPVRFGEWRRDGTRAQVSAADSAVIDALTPLEVRQGDVHSLRDGGVLVSVREADAHAWKVGSVVSMEFARTGVQQVPVKGIYAERRLVGDYLIDLSTYEKNFTDKRDQIVVAKLKPGISLEAGRRAIDAAVADFPNAVVRDQAQEKANAEKQVDQLLGLIYALLALAVGIALFGIVNTLGLSIFERVRELGLLRAVGMSRRQIRKMIRWEAVIVALLGATLGLAVGCFFGWALVKALNGEGITEFAFPLGQVIVFYVLAALAGMLAAIVPGWRAAKVDVLRALAAT